MAIKISRKSLQKSVGKKVVLTGKFIEKGYCKQTKIPNSTALFLDIINENGDIMSDHCWVRLKNPENVNIIKDSIVKFSAIVRPYLKERKVTYKKGKESDLKVSLGLIDAEILEVI